jgi:hypothetical protein
MADIRSGAGARALLPHALGRVRRRILNADDMNPLGEAAASSSSSRTLSTRRAEKLDQYALLLAS